ncbi:MAG: twin-arginine translocase subunit TatC [Acidimicrobiales bacterium]|jgi:sec-independent protein translocase protein TatC
MVARLRIPFRRGAARPDPDAMTLGEHLAELRRRILVAVIAFAVAGTVAFIVYPHILSFLQAPYCNVVRPRPCSLYITAPLDGLALRLKLATYGGLFLASPVILWQLWRFITPGLRRNEKRYVIPFIFASVLLFSAGAVLAYYTFPHALRFLQSVGGPSLKQIYNPNSYIGLIVALMFVFGLTFEFPVVLVSLELVGVLRPERLASWRRWAIVVITVFAAVITPSGDPFSMLALAVPLYVFYEVSIVIGKLLRR